MLKLVDQENSQELYEYYCANLVGTAPYYHEASKKQWLESFYEDRDYEGDKKYSELVTYCSQSDAGIINGFIQFGVSSYGYDEEGEKSFKTRTGVIRQLHFLEGQTVVGQKLFKTAVDYFQERTVPLSYAFFHALGLTCTGNHGKLHESMPEIAALLLNNGFGIEHTNVYYKKNLQVAKEKIESTLHIKRAVKTEHHTQMFTFYEKEEAVGQANIAFLPETSIAYLRWIFMLDDQQNKGFGTQALQLIFEYLSQQGITELHTDTADANSRAQHVYEKNGFQHLGLTRSYMRV